MGMPILVVGLWLLFAGWGAGALQAGDRGQVLAGPPASLAATLTVTSTADSGYGTLRWALQTAVAGDTISFDPAVFPPASPATILLATALPSITQGNLTIDGSNAGVILDGGGAPVGTFGLDIASSGNAVRGLQIVRFPAWGIGISSGQENHVGGSRALGSGPLGQGNLLSGNGQHGLFIKDDRNTVAGNYIGTDVSGRAAFANGGDGVVIDADYTVVGSSTPGEGNVISGNTHLGVRIGGGEHNLVIGNLIGLAVSGGSVVGNGDAGVGIVDGAHVSTVGGSAAGERNVISGNGGAGVRIGILKNGPAAYDNTVVGNYIGTDLSGWGAIGNAGGGVVIDNGATRNGIGGPWPAERNVISGNAVHGVSIMGGATLTNTVIGNYIGANAAGTASLPNGEAGVNVEAPSNRIGGIHGGEGNLISGNGNYGVRLAGGLAHHNQVAGNFIGTNASGSAGLGNGRMGVLVEGGATYNTIGGIRAPGPGMGPLGGGNLISGNGEHGVAISGGETVSNTVLGNYIGVNLSGTAALANAHDGVKLEAPNNRVGGSTPGDQNLISGNTDNGVRLTGSAARHNVVRGNLIGTNASGTGAVANSIGILIADDAQYNVVGGAAAGERNVISGNSGAGINIDVMKGGPAGHHNAIVGNYIGVDVGGSAALSNFVGVQMCRAAADNTVGGGAPGEGNVIAGSRFLAGIYVCDGATRNQIVGNYIGTDASGTLALGSGAGIMIVSGAHDNTVGQGNRIAYNLSAGVRIGGSTTLANTVTQNAIYSNDTQGIDNLGGGNLERPAPALGRLALGHILRGTACAGCTVEVFSDAQDEGRVYEGSVTADVAGRFSFGRPGGFAGPNLTATATDAAGNTSEFSAPVAVRYFVYSPVIRR